MNRRRFLRTASGLFVAAAPALIIPKATAQLAGGLMFPGPGMPHSAGGGSPTFTQLGTATGGLQSGTSQITFASQPLGTAGANRKLILSVGGSPQGGTISGITAGGNAMTLLSGLSTDFNQLYYVASPGGTGNIVVTYSTTGSAELAISLAEVTGITTIANVASASLGFQSTPYAPAALNPVTVPASGYCVVVGVWQSTFTMNGVTNDSGSLSVTTQSLTVVSGHLTTSGNVTFTGASSNIGYAAGTFGP